MARTAAQKAARKRRRKAKAGRGPAYTPPKKHQGMKGKRGPMFTNPQPVGNRKSRPRQNTHLNGGARAGGNKTMGEIYSMPYREECLGPVSTSVAFAVSQALVLNAGNSITFPWLGSIAPKFEYYRFKKLALRYENSSATAIASTNTALGTVLVNANYDVLDPQFASQIEMEAYGGGNLVSEKEPSVTFTHRMEPNGIRGGVQGGWRYVLASTATSAAGQPYPASSSAHDYDIGLLQIASAGAQAASVAGRLYMCYEVEFCNPKIVPGSPVGGVVHFSSIASTTANNFAGAIQQSGGTLGGIVLGTNTITFPANIPGSYLLLQTVAGATGATPFSFASLGAATAINLLTQSAVRDATDVVFSNAGTTTAPAMDVLCVIVPAAGCTITMNPSTVVGTGSMDLFVFALPSTVLTIDQIEQLEIDELKDEVGELRSQLNEIHAMLLAGRVDGSCGSSSVKAVVHAFDAPDDSEEEMEKSIHITKREVLKLLKA